MIRASPFWTINLDEFGEDALGVDVDSVTHVLR